MLLEAPDQGFALYLAPIIIGALKDFVPIVFNLLSHFKHTNFNFYYFKIKRNKGRRSPRLLRAELPTETVFVVTFIPYVERDNGIEPSLALTLEVSRAPPTTLIPLIMKLFEALPRIGPGLHLYQRCVLPLNYKAILY